MKLFITKNILLLITAIVINIIPGCNPSFDNGRELDIKISSVKINAWENLMPGKEATFYISGTVNIKNKGKDALNSIRLREIKIFQGSDSVSSSRILFSSPSGNNSINPDKAAHFDFKLNWILNSIKKINMDKLISVKLIFTSSGKNYNFTVNNLKIEKVY